MKKKKNILLLLIALFISLFSIKVSAANYKVVDSFPNKLNIGPKKSAGNYSNNWFNYIGTSDCATYCSMWAWDLPAEEECNIINSGVYAWDDATKAGVAYIIKQANANNNDMSESYYYGLIAINDFLYDIEGADTGQNLNNDHDTTYRIGHIPFNQVLGNYYSWYTGAKQEYNTIKSLKTTKPKLTLLSATDSNGTNYNKTSIDLSQSNVNTVTYKFKITSGPYDRYNLTGNMSLNSSAHITINGNNVTYGNTTTISNLHNNDEITIVFDNMAESQVNTSIVLKLEGAKDYHIAANYNCGVNWNNDQNQNVTPNMIKAETKLSSTSAKVNLTKGVIKPKLRVTKTDNNNQPLAGAQIQLYESEYDDTYIEQTDANGIIEFENLDDGEYCITEVTAPNGYVSSDINRCFSIDDDNNITTNDNNITIDQNNKLITTTIVNDITRLSIAKVDKNGNKIANAGLKLVSFMDALNDNWDAYVLNGEPLEWISTTEAKVIEGLPTGYYYIVETNAPAGYIKEELPQLILFNGINQENYFEFKDETINVVISKVDITTKEELPGATLRILDENGNVVKLNGEELVWVSTTEQKIIQGLPAGTYYLEETQAPEGYAKMTEKIKFTLDINGNTTIDESTDDGSVIIMTNAHTKVYISKQDITTKEELPGATLKLLDKNGEVVVLNDEELIWVSGDTPHYIEGLPIGTYTLVEVTSPDGYSLNTESITFTINEDGTITGDTVMYNTPIPNVPSTLSNKSIVITLIGIIIIALGVWAYQHSLKYNK